ncbi:hypothetical protein BDN72DRAFT_768361 [Pluteus cervinus]|uniref:Uncharacterized protein n=1 Tax=Pluteus cervinus TaxID=181527 RepID=A0ACD3ATM2_9AGAR|nr:hypothetical protein BDN72DRAFT_768361 [Pluteus cervinus]
MWERPNYDIPIEATISGIKARLEQIGNLLSFEVQSPPYRGGILRAWAQYTSPALAQKAQEALHRRKPKCTGYTRIFVQQVKSFAYRLSSELYPKISSCILNLAATVYRRYPTSSIRIKVQESIVLIETSSIDYKTLGQIKRRLDDVLCGEIIYREDGQIAWDGFFLSPRGSSFLKNLERQTEGGVVKCYPERRCIQVFGTCHARISFRREILKWLDDLGSQTIRTISVSRRVAVLLNSKGSAMAWETGAVSLDPSQQFVSVRGTDQLFRSVYQAIEDLNPTHRIGQLHRNRCPVCFDAVVSPVSLACHHMWCRSCFKRYLTADIDAQSFPLLCLGDEGKCQQRIPLHLAHSLLPLTNFIALVEAAFTSYVRTHAEAFRYCPTPGCQQVFSVGLTHRPALQCPFCLIRLCASCHGHYHQGLPCRDGADTNKLFQEWMEENDIKKCPGCKVPIEKGEGCNHIVCTRCNTHLCWVCLETFPGGQGVYDHMRNHHGGIGPVL